MKKRVINHAMDIARNANPKIKVNGRPCQFWTDGHTYVVDDCRVLEVEHLLDDLVTNENQSMAEVCKRSMDAVCDRDLDYLRIENIPSVSEIKTEIRKLVGRKLDTVIYSYEGVFAINARYLYKAMEALNASAVYVSRNKPSTSQVFLFENDDPQSTVKELILPIRVSLYVPGFSVAN